MGMHPRTIVCARAEGELAYAIAETVQRHGLTSLEAMSVVQRASSDYMNHRLKHELRYERHGNYDTPADEEGEPPRPTARFKRKLMEG